MTTLSARFVRKPRRIYVCDWCEKPIDGPHIRLYGNGEHEPMWTLRMHAACCSPETCDTKVQAALRQANEQETQ